MHGRGLLAWWSDGVVFRFEVGLGAVERCVGCGIGIGIGTGTGLTPPRYRGRDEHAGLRGVDAPRHLRQGRSRPSTLYHHRRQLSFSPNHHATARN